MITDKIFFISFKNNLTLGKQYKQGLRAYPCLLYREKWLKNTELVLLAKHQKEEET